MKNGSRIGPTSLSRRDFVQHCVIGASTLAAMPILTTRAMAKAGASASGPASFVTLLDQDWLFGGKLDPAMLKPEFDDTSFHKVTLPHCPTKLSWQNWDFKDWQEVWCYRRKFDLPRDFKGGRVFLEFDGVMVGAEPTINGHTLPKHLGGYDRFNYEITEFVKNTNNVLALAVDSRWSNVPPQGSPKGPQRVDYLEAGGIHRPIRLRMVPQVFINDVFAKPVRVLDPAARRMEVLCSVNAAAMPGKPLSIKAVLRDGDRTISHTQKTLEIEKPGVAETTVVLSDLGKVKLWDVDSPNLYHVEVTLSIDGKPVHNYRVRTGFREARFELDGFYLNGRRLQIFGLNRHEVYPYVGYAMPPRVKRRDAEILKRDFNCNFVRCSHYPQSPAFLDACDELGLLVWQEPPGWGYLGDEAWKELLVRDVREMIVRDRSRPSIVIWATRANETENEVELYRKTKALAKSLDDTRPTSGSMTGGSRKNWQRDWHEDVFAFDDYHADPDGTVGIDDPVPGHPYMLAEAVGQYNYATAKGFTSYYRRSGDPVMLRQQALRHAQAHSKAASRPRICGVVAWCGFEYSSLVNAYHNIKHPGVADVFRIPKLGASFYLAQCDPKSRVVIEPDFYWDFGPQTPRGPGKGAAIFSNCDRLEVFVAGRHHASLQPDAKNYPHLKHAPFFVDLDFDAAGHPELRIDGYLASRKTLSRSFSADSAQDQFIITADDKELIGDGSDATRLVFKVADKFGALRAFGTGTVRFEIAGPGEIIGDNPFNLAESGGAAAVWVKTRPKASGSIIVTARHSELGTRTVRVKVLSEQN